MSDERKLKNPGTFDILAACLASARQHARNVDELRLIDRIVLMICDDMEETHARFIRESFCRRAHRGYGVPLYEEEH